MWLCLFALWTVNGGWSVCLPPVRRSANSNWLYLGGYVAGDCITRVTDTRGGSHILNRRSDRHHMSHRRKIKVQLCCPAAVAGLKRAALVPAPATPCSRPTGGRWRGEQGWPIWTVNISGTVPWSSILQPFGAVHRLAAVSGANGGLPIEHREAQQRKCADVRAVYVPFPSSAGRRVRRCRQFVSPPGLF